MTGPEIDTASGRVRGRLVDGTNVFKGIPYAAPTSGANRLARPVPPAPWTDVRDALEVGPTAPQNPSILEQMLGADDPVINEDCLNLNVFAPDGASGLPVMVWIHGGGYVTGTGSIPWYDGSHLAQRGTVVVTLNYRLGVLGFLHLADIGAGFEGAGNLGILDQVAALEWVRDNIAAFGGDPTNVTVFGESAGAMSIGTLLGVPAAHGLFHRAILQSGAADHVHTAETATGWSLKFLAELGVDPGDLSSLRDVPLDEVLAAQARFTASVPFDDGLPLLPVVDGTVLPEAPLDAVAAGRAAGIDVLVGTNTEEMNMFLLMEPGLAALDETTLGTRADSLFVPQGHGAGEALAVYRADRPEAPVADVLCAMLTDHTFRIPAIKLAQAQAAHHGAVWMYLFAYRTPAFGGALGACHALEIPFVWENLDAQGAAMFAGEPTDEMRALATTMADAWVAFAATGDPATAGTGDWPRYEPGRRATLQFDVGSVELLDDPFPAERELWT